MKKFKFRLETVLQLRQRKEDEKKKVVGELVSKINEQQNQAIEMSRILQQEGQHLKSQHELGQIDLNWMSQYRRYVSHIHQAINHRIENVTQIQNELQHARMDLMHATREKKIIEKLKEKKHKLYKKELNKEQAREQDEVAQQLYLRSSTAVDH